MQRVIGLPVKYQKGNLKDNTEVPQIKIKTEDHQKDRVYATAGLCQEIPQPGCAGLPPRGGRLCGRIECDVCEDRGNVDFEFHSWQI